MAHNWNDNKERTSDVQITEKITFSRMMLSDNVLNGLEQNGYVRPSPIQLRAIPLGRCGYDLLIQSKAGTGKTLVFATIILERYKESIKSPQTLIIAPTREIAVQIEQTMQSIGSHTTGFKICSFIGGLNVVDDRQRIQGCCAIVGTPGRLLHLINNNVFNTSTIELIVLDEADQLMSDSFKDDVKKILNITRNPNIQMLSLSATYKMKSITKLTNFMSKNYIAVTPKREPPILLGVKQLVFDNCDFTLAPPDHMNPMINDGVRDVDEPSQNQQKNSKPVMSAKKMLEKINEIIRIFQMVSFKQCLIFSNSQSRAQTYCNYINQKNWPAECINGGQDQRTRLMIFEKFRKFDCRILCATDLMARGIDSEHVNLIINLDVPTCSSIYLHRIGRCGRFGTNGLAITFIDSIQELYEFRRLLGEIGGNKMIVHKFPKSDECDGGDGHLLNAILENVDSLSKLETIHGLCSTNGDFDGDDHDDRYNDTKNVTENQEILSGIAKAKEQSNDKFVAMLLSNDSNSSSSSCSSSISSDNKVTKNNKETDNVDDKIIITEETQSVINENLMLLSMAKCLIDNNDISNDSRSKDIFQRYRKYQLDDIPTELNDTPSKSKELSSESIEIASESENEMLSKSKEIQSKKFIGSAKTNEQSDDKCVAKLLANDGSSSSDSSNTNATINNKETHRNKDEIIITEENQSIKNENLTLLSMAQGLMNTYDVSNESRPKDIFQSYRKFQLNEIPTENNPIPSAPIAIPVESNKIPSESNEILKNLKNVNEEIEAPSKVLVENINSSSENCSTGNNSDESEESSSSFPSSQSSFICLPKSTRSSLSLSDKRVNHKQIASTVTTTDNQNSRTADTNRNSIQNKLKENIRMEKQTEASQRNASKTKKSSTFSGQNDKTTKNEQLPQDAHGSALDAWTNIYWNQLSQIQMHSNHCKQMQKQ